MTKISSAREGWRFRMAMFISCYVGCDGGLADILAKVNPITTLSFKTAVPLAHLKSTFTTFVGCFTIILLNFFMRDTMTLKAMINVAAKHYCSLFEAVEILTGYKVFAAAGDGAAQLDEDVMMGGITHEALARAIDNPEPPKLHGTHCTPMLRNPLGFHDDKWWGLESSQGVPSRSSQRLARPHECSGSLRVLRAFPRSFPESAL